MNTLEDAWEWYRSVRTNLVLMRRIADRHFRELSIESTIRQDERFKHLDPVALGASATHGLEPLNDLAVLVLFSVFESIVRNRVRADLAIEAGTLEHPILKRAAESALETVEAGAFFRVLEPFKIEISSHLIEDVNQVRRYRNWVAHGRRDEPSEIITPEVAFERLGRFIKAIQPDA